MPKMNSLLAQRMQVDTNKPSKMTSLADRSSHGHLSSFSGVFKVAPLAEEEVVSLHTFLQTYQKEDCNTELDLSKLSSITSELKAINNQAVILHGERIKKAQDILKNYQEGAFTFWLIRTYGNRQTPYNFLQYFELHQQIATDLLPQLDAMPRQAAYTLASREGSFSKKEELIRNYRGETKEKVLETIRKEFPLSSRDKRKQKAPIALIKNLRKISSWLSINSFPINNAQKRQIVTLLQTIQQQVQEKDAL